MKPGNAFFRLPRKSVIVLATALIFVAVLALALIWPQFLRERQAENSLIRTEQDLAQARAHENEIATRISSRETELGRERDLLARLRKNDENLDLYVSNLKIRSLPSPAPYSEEPAALPGLFNDLILGSGLTSPQVRVQEEVSSGPLRGVLFYLGGSGSLADIQALILTLLRQPFVHSIIQSQIQDYADQRLFQCQILVELAPLAEDPGPTAVRTDEAKETIQ
ncbi:MAG: hypothetical protein EOM25_11260 [Deltaproteobacteria bacterium]|nr:hypothetical protein [Deltaproteobacteria bacterium]